MLQLGGSRWALCQLALLTSSYVVGELSHFLIGVTSRDVAREIHYGDQACFPSPERQAEQHEAIEPACQLAENQTSCSRLPGCSWEYTGLGLDYQLLAGPSFIAVFTVSGIVLGFWADVVSRTRLLGSAVFLFSLATMATGLATQYWHLVLGRMTLAAGEAACSPLGVSLISDLFDSNHRGTASGIFHWGVYFGYGLSYAMGVYVTKADFFGMGWRWCFLLAGLPGTVIGTLLIMSPDVKETNFPESPATPAKLDGIEEERLQLNKDSAATSSLAWREKEREASSPVSKRLGHTLCTLLQPALICLFIAASFRHAAGFSFAYNARLYFLTYYPWCDVGAWLSWVSIVGGSVGVVLGGAVSDKVGQKWGSAARLWVLGVAMLLASPFAFGVLYFSPPTSFITLMGYYILAETWFGIVFVVLVEVVPNSVKTSILGVFLFLMNNTGGNVPVLVDPLSKAIGYRETLFIFYPLFVAISGMFFLISSIPLKSSTKSSR